MEKKGLHSQAAIRRADAATASVLSQFSDERNNPDVQAAAYYASEGTLLADEERMKTIERDPLGYVEEILQSLKNESADAEGFTKRGLEKLAESTEFWKSEIATRYNQADKYHMRRPSLSSIATSVQAAYAAEPIVGTMVNGGRYVAFPRARVISPYEDERTHDLVTPSDELINAYFIRMGALSESEDLREEVEKRKLRTSMSSLNDGNLIFPTDSPKLFLQYDDVHSAVNLLYSPDCLAL